MIKITYAFVLLGLLFSLSCSKDEENKPKENNPYVGTWKLVKYTEQKGGNGAIEVNVDLSDLTECAKATRLIVSSINTGDNTGSSKEDFEMPGTNCQLQSEFSTWTNLENGNYKKVIENGNEDLTLDAVITFSNENKTMVSKIVFGKDALSSIIRKTYARQ